MAHQPTRKRWNEFPSYKGGDTVVYGGYIHEYAPHHPCSNLWGFVAQHRLIGEAIAGRPLIQHGDPKIRECVHHIDENRLNNSISNLQVLTFHEHRKIHGKRMAAVNQANLNEDNLRKLLEKHGTLMGAAKEMHVHHQTLRNRFPAIVAPYLRASPFDMGNTVERERLVSVIRYFAPTYMSFSELAKLTRVCAKQLAELSRQNGIEWVRAPLGAPGKKRMTYGGKPTRSALEADDQKIAPA